MSKLSDLLYAIPLDRDQKFANFKEYVEKSCTSEELTEELKSGGGNNILMAAFYYSNKNYFKTLLDSPLCTSEVLEWTKSPEKRTILHDVVEDFGKDTEKLDWILDHENLSEKCLHQQNTFGESALSLAIHHNYSEAIEKLINHRHCTQKTFEVSPAATILHYAVEKGSAKNIKLLANSPKITTKFLRIQDEEHKTALDLAIERRKLEVLKALLESPHCTVDFIKEQKLLEKVTKTNEEFINLVKKHEGRDSYKRIYEIVGKNQGTEFDQAVALLRDYASPWRYARFHWNRHHVDDVNDILGKIDEKKIEDIDGLIDELNKLQAKLPNQVGSLSRRIEFIKKDHAYNLMQAVQNEDPLESNSSHEKAPQNL